MHGLNSIGAKLHCRSQQDRWICNWQCIWGPFEFVETWSSPWKYMCATLAINVYEDKDPDLLDMKPNCHHSDVACSWALLNQTSEKTVLSTFWLLKASSMGLLEQESASEGPTISALLSMPTPGSQPCSVAPDPHVRAQSVCRVLTDFRLHEQEFSWF